jgi:hypothetical protein
LQTSAPSIDRSTRYLAIYNRKFGAYRSRSFGALHGSLFHTIIMFVALLTMSSAAAGPCPVNFQKIAQLSAPFSTSIIVNKKRRDFTLVRSRRSSLVCNKRSDDCRGVFKHTRHALLHTQQSSIYNISHINLIEIDAVRL